LGHPGVVVILLGEVTIGTHLGRTLAAAFALGADGIQVGSRFAIAAESSAHNAYKKAVIDSLEGDTVLTLKSLTPVRLLKNAFYIRVENAIAKCATKEELAMLLGQRRAKQGIFEGNLEEGELEIGQVAAGLKQIETAADIVNDIWSGFLQTKERLQLL